MFDSLPKICFTHTVLRLLQKKSQHFVLTNFPLLSKAYGWLDFSVKVDGQEK